MDITEIKSLIERQGEAFEAYKATLDEKVGEIKKGGAADPVLLDRMEKVEKSLDDAVEGKAAIEAAIEAERKEREELEIRLQRHGVRGDGEDAKAELARREFNTVLAAHAADQKRAFQPLDAEQFDAYKSAFANALRKNERGLEDHEIKALSVGSDPDGGYVVDPDTSGRIVRKVYETSPIRQIASQITISTDKLEGMEDTGEAGAGWVGETGSRSDTTTPQLGQYTIEAFEAYAHPKATQKLLDDAAIDIAGWLGEKVSDRLARLENAAFVTGTGVLQPKGFAAYTTAADSGSGVTWGTIGHVVSTANGAFAASDPGDDIFELIGTVKEAYLGNARFVTRRSVITDIRQFKDGQGNYLWQPSFVAGQPEMIAGYPVTRAEDIPALATGSLSLWFGDFRAAYQIVDRQGVRVLRDPYTDKPYVIFYTTKRVGGGVVNFEAIKAMKFSA